MKRFTTIPFLILTLCATALSQTSPKPDVGTFDLIPVAPPTPALKYQLLFDDLTDRRPGNAAILYFDSILLIGQDAENKAEKALDAHNKKDMTQFNQLADSIDNHNLFEELDLAARREQCDWEPPFREMGGNTLLPHLVHLRNLGRILKVHALREIEQGKIDDALKTIRLGYVLAKDVAKEPMLISGLVSINIASGMNDCLREIMIRPDAPNLYWALSEFPTEREIIRACWDGEREWWAASNPRLAKLKAGEELTADEWRKLLAEINNDMNGPAKLSTFDPMMNVSPELLQQAREQYASNHHVTPEQTTAIDPLIIVGDFYFQQFQIVNDDFFKLRALPYPLLLAKTNQFAGSLKKLQADEPGNLFLNAVPTFHKAAWTLASTDRQLAAMTAVEAIRSYAAANSGKLPARLEDISDTPVPDNPVTGLPFDYGVNGDVATLSDSQSETTLKYTIKIRN